MTATCPIPTGERDLAKSYTTDTGAVNLLSLIQVPQRAAERPLDLDGLLRRLELRHS
ncbi:hypothetical protein YTPLAS18_10520 [Nitrospira sp.]|nr:hypothetical protein YTPLAS18_10520 [Nitrospira sp.]